MSATLAAAIFLPLAPAGMVIAYWRGRRAKERQAIELFASQVEFNMIVRHRG